MARLKELLEDRSSTPISGRLVARQIARKPAPVVERTDSSFLKDPDWVVPYKATPHGTFPHEVELGETHNARYIVPFVQRVVDMESPVHFDVLSTRLREHAGIGRVGHRIRATLQRAVQLANVKVDGDFLISEKVPLDKVRAATYVNSRSVESIHPREFELAVRFVVRDAAGASRADVTEAVSRAFGWNRTTVAMSTVIGGTIDRLIAAGALRETGARITVA